MFPAGGRFVKAAFAHIAIHRVLSFTVSFPATVSDSQPSMRILLPNLRAQ